MTTCSNESMGRMIYKTSLDLRNYAERLLSPYDLTVEQFHLLNNISPTTGISQNRLCSSVGKKPANITRILDRLEKKSWISRQPNPDDRRSSLVFLTDEGERVIRQVSSKFESYSSWFIEGISHEEELIFRRVLEKINRNIQKLMAKIDLENV